jgi:uncharacterized membrane protein YfcA
MPLFINRSANAVRRLWPFALWLACFYLVWLTLVVAGGHWSDVANHWPISLAMAFGSYVAGSTPMGGGTVGFPILTLLFDHPASLGRNFGLAIQSIGMTSASIYIFAARRRIDVGVLLPALAGSLIATPLSAAFIAPLASDLGVKLLFAIIWASFGIIHLAKLKQITKPEADRIADPRVDWPIGLIIGVVGGCVAALTGVGIDMMVYAALVLFYRADVKIAIPTSVILMAFTSIIGILSNLALAALAPTTFGLSDELYFNWLAAAPVVALGAPFGALIVNLIPRETTLRIVSFLCIAQFVWTVFDQRVFGVGLFASLAAIAVLTFCFWRLYLIGEKRTKP